MYMPREVVWALEKLNSAGYEAYVVGGCVRDSLMGRTPGDYDITTSALPQETEQVFAGERLIETGLKHGTVTVLREGMPLEITTFRVDGGYSDSRHPDEVRFTRSLREDAARRDFTVNAMACGTDGAIKDYYGGQEDLQNRLIRCVGDPRLRFEEDALRILRALRFSSVLGFSIDPAAEEAMRSRKSLLRRISAERVYNELTKLLCGGNVREVLCRYPDILGEVIPELLPMVGFEQHNCHHIYDVWGHTAAVVEAVPPQPVLRLAALLHDCGKPETFTLGPDGVGHFYGHADHSAVLAEKILRRLKADSETRERVVLLVKRHDALIENTPRAVKHVLNKMGEQGFFDLISLKKADNMGQNPEYRCRQQGHAALEETARRILEEKQCFSLKDLAVSGKDVLAAGVPAGPQVGQILAELLEDVVNEKAPNERQALLKRIEFLRAQASGRS